MATKDIILRKRLIKEGIIFFLALAILFAAGMMLSDYDDSTLSEKNTKEGENSSLRAQHASIQQELGTDIDVSTYYNTYFAGHNRNFLLNREFAAEWMAVMREKNHLANLALTISPTTDMPQDFMHLKSNIVTKNDVTLTFGAVSDNSIYGFIEAMERALPGIASFKDLRFTRDRELARNVITELSQHHIMPLVTGEISFSWLGMRSVEDAKNPRSGLFHGPGNAP